jgi:tetratricopeptide (TPR) repeat protein
MKHARHARIALAILAGMLLAAIGATQPPRAPSATGPATAPATASAPAERLVEWHLQHKGAADEARKRNCLLVVVFFDPDAPACQDYQARTLSDLQTRRLLGGFAAARLKVTAGDGKKRFAATGPKATPLTQVFTPAGELLDSFPGCIIPPGRLHERLGKSQAYWKAAAARPATVERRWEAAEARLSLSTRHKSAGEIQALLKLPAKALPEGLTQGRLKLALGRAWELSRPEQARTHLLAARKLAPKDAAVAGDALLVLSAIAKRDRKYKQAHQFCAEYIKAFPKGEGIGQAYHTKAVLEYSALDDRAAARETLSGFLEDYPDHPMAVRIRELLEAIKE